MIHFLIKGLLRDKHRSIFPIFVVSGGVMITCFLHSYLNGVMGDFVRTNANFDTGHVKIMTRAYAEISDQLPNDLCLTDAGDFISELSEAYPNLEWVPRIRFGGLLDFPDETGETRAQGPVLGIGLELFKPGSSEIERFNLRNSMVRGRLPQLPGEIVISDEFAEKLKVKVGDVATLISATATGSMAVQNFTVSGTVRLGISTLDASILIADLKDVQYTLDMEGAAGEILGFFSSDFYEAETADVVTAAFNAKYADSDDEFAPVMFTLKQQNNLGGMLDFVDYEGFILVSVFVFVISIILWNAGLMSGIRRYGEMGLRLAIGESKGHVYKLLIAESVAVGIIGSTLGTGLGLAGGYYLQEVGIDISTFMQNSTVLFADVVRARVTTTSYFIGFIPGLMATIIGAMISGIGIFKRETSQLFKELEA